MDTTITVSVVIPTWNECPQILSLLNSLRSRRVLPREVILVDKYSTDDTASCAFNFGAKVLYDSGSVAQARNMGVEKCSGKLWPSQRVT